MTPSTNTTNATKIYSKILGTGSYLPANKVTNAKITEMLAKDGIETSDEWIFSRSGISARHFAADHELTSDLALKASQKAIEAAGAFAIVLEMVPEDLAATMLATTLGIEFNADTAWDEREKQFKMSGQILKTFNIWQWRK